MITLLSAVPAQAKELRILFTHDIHSYLDPSTGITDGKKQSHGGAAKLAHLISENRTDSTLIVDAGDYAMGTLYQAGFTENAYELRMLGKLGFDVTTFGNHEFDLGGYGLTDEELNERISRAGLFIEFADSFIRDAQGFARINLACPRSIVQKAMDILVSVLEKA